MDSFKSYLCHSIEFVLNRLNDRFHESDGIRYLVTHIEFCIFYLVHRPCLTLPTSWSVRCKELIKCGDDNSLQRRLFRFSGCRARPSINIPRELLEQYLENNFTPEQIARLFCVSSM